MSLRPCYLKETPLTNDFPSIAYGIYVWANKTDEYNNSKAGHIAHGGAH